MVLKTFRRMRGAVDDLNRANNAVFWEFSGSLVHADPSFGVWARLAGRVEVNALADVGRNGSELTEFGAMQICSTKGCLMLMARRVVSIGRFYLDLLRARLQTCHSGLLKLAASAAEVGWRRAYLSGLSRVLFGVCGTAKAVPLSKETNYVGLPWAT